MRVLMVGVDSSTKGGMWTVVKNYLDDNEFVAKTNLKYIPTSITGNIIKRILFNLFSIIRIFFYTLFNSYDILHVHMSEKGSVYRKNIIINISKIRKAKVIIHMHGAEFEKWYNTLSDSKKEKVKEILNKADKIVILGEYWRKFIDSLMNDKTKIEVIYNAVKIPKNTNYDVNSNKLLFLGVVGKRKGIYDLIEAMKQIKKINVCKCKLLIYGPDTTDEGINKLITSAGLNDFIDYKGWLSEENKVKVLKKCSINILPSYNEGLPMTILETMSYGIPNISTDVAAIPEVVNDENGILIKPGDINTLTKAIVNLMTDKKARIKKSINSYKMVSEKCSLEKHIDSVYSLYSKLIN